MDRWICVSMLVLAAYSSAGQAQILPQEVYYEPVRGTATLNVTDAYAYFSVETFDQSQLNVLAGGQMTWLYTNNDSSVSVFEGGSVGLLEAYDRSTIDVLGGIVNFVSLYDDSHFRLDGSTAFLDIYDRGSAKILGGETSWLSVYNQGRAEIRGGDISWLTLSQGAAIDVYGYDFEFRDGHLNGRWSDGTAFSFWVRLAEGPLEEAMIAGPLPANVSLHPVPLPAAGWLFLAGLPLLRIRRRS